MAMSSAEKSAAWRSRHKERIRALEVAAGKEREPDVDTARQVLARHIAEALAVGGDEAFFAEIRQLNKALKAEGSWWRISEVAPR